MSFATQLATALGQTPDTFAGEAVQNIDFTLLSAVLVGMASRMDAIDGGGLDVLSPLIKLPDDGGDGGDDFFVHANGDKLLVRADTDNTGTADLDMLELDAAGQTAKAFGSELLTAANAASLFASNIAQTTYADYKLYAASTDTHLSDLDVTFTPESASQRVLLLGNFMIESHNDAMMYLKRDGVEIGSAAAAGSRSYGLIPIFYDTQNQNTPFQQVPIYLDAPATTSAITYSWHIRRASALPVSLNGGLSDTDITSAERGVSTIIAMGV